jgi:CRISPR/Cas system-associated exonuclease Cas4 (RecB family)
MSQYYNPKRSRNLFDPKSPKPFSISRSKIDLFIECPCCFYLDRRLGVGRPPGFPFNLNAAVDKLLKKEFDIHRAKGDIHPLMAQYGIDAIPYEHEDLDKWRENFVGIQYLHAPTNLNITGAIDDVWINSKGELIVVDYKATSKDSEVNIDAQWQDGYKRQMEVYQWLFRANGFKVSDTGYFVYVNGRTDKEAFDGKLEFDVKIIPYKGSDAWIEKVIKTIHKCLMDDRVPLPGRTCDYCAYRRSALDVLPAKKPKAPKAPAKGLFE